MNTASTMNELAAEYVRFQKLSQNEQDFQAQLMHYEKLTNMLDKAGISFYDLSVFVKSRS